MSVNFELSLNRTTWAHTLTLDPTGEVFYVRLADTGTVGEYDGIITAATTQVRSYADVHGTVNPKTVQIGDVNKDGIVNISDVTTLINYLLTGSVSPFDYDAADVSDDGGISITDVTALINLLLTGSTVNANALWAAYPAEGGILVDNHSGEVLEVFDFDGTCCATVMSQGVVNIDLTPGIYVVTSDTESLKVVVK